MKWWCWQRKAVLPWVSLKEMCLWPRQWFVCLLEGQLQLIYLCTTNNSIFLIKVTADFTEWEQGTCMLHSDLSFQLTDWKEPFIWNRLLTRKLHVMYSLKVCKWHICNMQKILHCGKQGGVLCSSVTKLLEALYQLKGNIIEVLSIHWKSRSKSYCLVL